MPLQVHMQTQFERHKCLYKHGMHVHGVLLGPCDAFIALFPQLLKEQAWLCWCVNPYRHAPSAQPGQVACHTPA